MAASRCGLVASRSACADAQFEGILTAGIDPLLQAPIRLTKKEFQDLVEFVSDGLFDRRVLQFCRHLPASVPSGMLLQLFEVCE